MSYARIFYRSPKPDEDERGVRQEFAILDHDEEGNNFWCIGEDKDRKPSLWRADPQPIQRKFVRDVGPWRPA